MTTATRTPQRIQWRRFDGPLPAGAKLTTRASRWGNPYPAEPHCPHRTRGRSVELFEQLLTTRTTDPAAHCECMTRDPLAYPSDARIRAKLGGRDLACGCDFDGPCHADVLLRWANEVER